jgi:hypothetical protein
MAIESLVRKKYFLTSEQSVMFCEFASLSIETGSIVNAMIIECSLLTVVSMAIESLEKNIFSLVSKV